MTIIKPITVIDEVLTLLSESSLPVSDISAENPPQFFGIHSEGKLVGVIGLELHLPFALLRSLSVLPSFRSAGLGRQLVAFAESVATSLGIEQLFLLTTTAEDFFRSLGYSVASRTTAPIVIQATAQFSGLCPSSSVFLCKYVGTKG